MSSGSIARSTNSDLGGVGLRKQGDPPRRNGVNGNPVVKGKALAKTRRACAVQTRSSSHRADIKSAKESGTAMEAQAAVEADGAVILDIIIGKAAGKRGTSQQSPA